MRKWRAYVQILDLLDGVKDGYLINPTVVDARTDVTTQLLADKGFVVSFTDDTGDEHVEAFGQRDFEKDFFSNVKSFARHSWKTRCGTQ